jgi:hypothetical protein
MDILIANSASVWSLSALALAFIVLLAWKLRGR